MTRRTALLASAAIMGSMLRDEKEVAAQTTSVLKLWTPPTRLTVQLGGEYGFKEYAFSNGHETIVISASQIWDALKADPVGK
jgi:hypothetical protein